MACLHILYGTVQIIFNIDIWEHNFILQPSAVFKEKLPVWWQSKLRNQVQHDDPGYVRLNIQLNK